MQPWPARALALTWRDLHRSVGTLLHAPSVLGGGGFPVVGAATAHPATRSTVFAITFLAGTFLCEKRTEFALCSGHRANSTYNRIFRAFAHPKCEKLVLGASAVHHVRSRLCSRFFGVGIQKNDKTPCALRAQVYIRLQAHARASRDGGQARDVGRTNGWIGHLRLRLCAQLGCPH